MAVIEAKINGTNTYKLCLWNAQDFESEPSLVLQTDDLKLAKEVFKEINKIEIYISNNLVATYTTFNTFSEFAYLGERFVEHENIFSSALKVYLTKANLVEQVQKIEARLNPVIDIESMTVEEYRKYILDQISIACQNDIHEGELITTSTGTAKYSYTTQDQIDLMLGVFMIVMGQLNGINVPYIPYHSNGNHCELKKSEDVMTIFYQLLISLLTKTTICNGDNMYVRSLTTKEELSECSYKMTLPEEYQSNIDAIISQTIAMIGQLTEKTTNVDTPVDVPMDATEENTNGEMEGTV